MDFSKFLTPESTVFLHNKDNSYKVLMHLMPGLDPHLIKDGLERYKWKEGKEFLLLTYPKCGTHLCWEVMQMLIKGKAEYEANSKAMMMLDLAPTEMIDDKFPPPRTLNTHYRLDVLPDEFQNRKTVLVIRNPKDVVVSYYNMFKFIHQMFGFDASQLKFNEFFETFLNCDDERVACGCYFKYTEYMWEISKTHPNMLVLYFEDLKRNPVENVKKLNEFMGTRRDDELIQEIADASDFDKMKQGKAQSEINLARAMGDKETVGKKMADGEAPPTIYRKGDIGDWKNWFTVEMNERFDKFLKAWKPAQEIPLVYE